MAKMSKVGGFQAQMDGGGLDGRCAGVGGILVPCTNHLYGPVLTLRMDHAPYASRIL